MSVSGSLPVAEGITNPPIDDLLTKTDSKYKLVLYAAKRARQLQNGARSMLPTTSKKPTVSAMEEVRRGLVQYEDSRYLAEHPVAAE